MREGRWRFAWAWTVGTVLGISIVGCGGGTTPPVEPTAPPPPCPPPTADPSFYWRGDDQVEITWPDMPVAVAGGSEDCVLQRRAVLELSKPLVITRVESFIAFDRGDVTEAVLAVYDARGRAVYRRSPHKESGLAGLYEPYDSKAYSWPATSTVFVDIACRVNAESTTTNQLAARCHFAATLTFGESSGPPPPPPDCEIPSADDPGWVGLDDARTTRDQLEAAKAEVGDRTGKDPLETLALLAQAVVDAGGCASGPWADEVAILAEVQDDGTLVVDGWHAVAFGTGGYTGNPKGDRWAYPPPSAGCGAPTPPAPRSYNVKLHQTKPKRTYDATPIVGPDVAFCKAIGYTDGRSFCPVRPDGHPEREACEAETFGAPQWTFEGEGVCFARPNPHQYRCEDDAHGTLTVCSSKAPNACGSIEVE